MMRHPMKQRTPRAPADIRDVVLNVPLSPELHRKLEEMARREKRSKRSHAAYILARECGWRSGDAAGQLNKSA
jgi:TraY domain